MHDVCGDVEIERSTANLTFCRLFLDIFLQYIFKRKKNLLYLNIASNIPLKTTSRLKSSYFKLFLILFLKYATK